MILYYVHHQGVGHLHRAAAVAAQLPGALTVLTSRTDAAAALPPGTPVLTLPRDDDPGTAQADPSADGSLHWAPVGDPGTRARMLQVADAVGGLSADLLVSDVSMEVLLLGRLLSVPTAAVLQRGRRADGVHRLGYAGARVLLAPWPRATQHPVPDAWRAKTVWTGAISRFDGRERVTGRCPRPGRCVLVVTGAGGHRLRAEDVVRAAATTGDSHWHVLGELAGPGPGPVQVHGWLPDPWPLLCRADVVVGTCGANLVADVAAAGTALVALPQPRPFGEQVEHARVLAEHGLAVRVGRWPAAGRWPGLLAQATALDPSRWQGYCDGKGGWRLAQALLATAR